MGRFPFRLFSLLFLPCLGLVCSPAVATHDVPVYLHITPANVRGFTPRLPITRGFLRLTDSAPFSRDSIVRLLAVARGGFDFTGDLERHIPWDDFPAPARDLLALLFKESLADVNSGWSVEMNGVRRDAVVLSWNLHGRAERFRRNGLSILGLRPTLYVPQQGQFELVRNLTAEEVNRRSIHLESPDDYRLEGASLPLSVDSGLLIRPPSVFEGQAPEWLRQSATPPNIVWIPGVVLLRDRSDHQGIESISATLWSDLDRNEPVKLTFRIGNEPQQIQLPREGARQALLTLRAHQNFEPLRLENRVFGGVRPFSLETLIVDMRGDAEPAYHFLLRRDSSQGMAGDLKVVKASAIQPAPRPIHPTVDAPWNHSVPTRLVREFLKWVEMTDVQMPKGLQGDRFLWFLARGAASDASYAEALVTLARLEDAGMSSLTRTGQPPLTEAQYQALQLNAEAFNESPATPVFVLQPQISEKFRLLSGAAASGRNIRTFFLDEPLKDPHTLLEIVAQSEAGRALVSEILPALRDGTLRFEFMQGQAQACVNLTAGPACTLLHLKLGEGVGHLIAPFVRTLYLGLRSGTAPPYSLEQLRAAYQLVQKVMVDLVRINPWMVNYIDDLSVPSDTQLMTDWALHTDTTVFQEVSRANNLCSRAVELMANLPPPSSEPKPRRRRLLRERE